MKTIYLVHDHQEPVDERVASLEETGFSVRTFTSGEQLYPELQREQPEIVLLDVMVDGPHGFLVCEEIRRLYSGTEVPVILMSGIYRGRRYHQEAARVGAQAYLLKPVGRDDMTRAIVEVIDEAKNPNAAQP